MEHGGSSYGFGRTYTNDTDLGGEPGESTFFAGTQYFSVNEIEVFEITDENRSEHDTPVTQVDI
jgi:hypothetical protein